MATLHIGLHGSEPIIVENIDRTAAEAVIRDATKPGAVGWQQVNDDPTIVFRTDHVVSMVITD